MKHFTLITLAVGLLLAGCGKGSKSTTSDPTGPAVESRLIQMYEASEFLGYYEVTIQEWRDPETKKIVKISTSLYSDKADPTKPKLINAWDEDGDGSIESIVINQKGDKAVSATFRDGQWQPKDSYTKSFDAQPFIWAARQIQAAQKYRTDKYFSEEWIFEP